MTSPLRPGDAEIRLALFERLRELHFDESDVVFLEEVGLCRGQVRVDVAVVNGALHGYEIKSDRDSLRRLGGQVAIYSRVLDRATVVVGRRHVDQAIDTLPPWWGIELAEVAAIGIRLKRIRAGRANPLRDARALVELLWLEDAIGLLEARDALRGYRGRPRRDVWNRVCELYDVDEVAEAVRTRLKARSAQRSLPPPA